MMTLSQTVYLLMHYDEIKNYFHKKPAEIDKFNRFVSYITKCDSIADKIQSQLNYNVYYLSKDKKGFNNLVNNMYPKSIRWLVFALAQNNDLIEDIWNNSDYKHVAKFYKRFNKKIVGGYNE